MKIGLLDVDGHNFPNLALMKISAWHKAQGDSIEWWMAIDKYDVVYKSKVFTFTPNIDVINADMVIQGGTGYNLSVKLPAEVEHIMPDYSLYGITDTAYGFLTRGCPRGCPFCVVSEKEGRASRKVADLSEWWNGQKNIKLLDPNLLACKDSGDLLKQIIDSKAKVDFTQGLDVRLIDADAADAINRINLKEIHFAWDLMQQSEAVLRGLETYAKYATRKPHGYCASVYVLTNFNTTMEENLYRIYKLRELNYDPYVMIYDKQNAPAETKRLQRWVNNKFIWRKCARYEDYKPC